MQTIEIPEPIIKVEYDLLRVEYDRSRGYSVATSKIPISIEIGGVDVMQFTYDSEADFYSPRYAEDIEDAKDKALAEFGQRLKEVLS